MTLFKGLFFTLVILIAALLSYNLFKLQFTNLIPVVNAQYGADPGAGGGIQDVSVSQTSGTGNVSVSVDPSTGYASISVTGDASGSVSYSFGGQTYSVSFSVSGGDIDAPSSQTPAAASSDGSGFSFSSGGAGGSVSDPGPDTGGTISSDPGGDANTGNTDPGGGDNNPGPGPVDPDPASPPPSVPPICIQNCNPIPPFAQLQPQPFCNAVDNSRIRLEWNPPGNVTYYLVYYVDSSDPSGTAQPPGGIPVSGRAYYADISEVNGLIPGRSYGFLIRAVNASNYYTDADGGQWSHQKFSTYTTLPPCNAPGAFSITGTTPACLAPDTSAVNITWDLNPAQVENTDSYTIIPITNNLAKDNYVPFSGFSPDTSGTLSQGLAAYWKLNETSGPALNDSVGGNTGTATNTTSALGKLVNSRVFTSEANSIETNPANLGISAGNISVTAWINPTGTSGWNPIIAQMSQSSGQNGWNFSYSPAYQLHFNPVGADCTTSYGGITTPAGYVPPANRWYFVAVTRQTSGFVRFYVDGVNVYNTTSPGGPLCANSIPINMGNFSWANTEYMVGRLDEVGVWNKELTPQEIADLYNSGQANNYTPPSGPEPNGRLAPIVINNPAPGAVRSYQYQIPGVVAPGETWQFSVTANNAIGSTPASNNPSAAVAGLNCSQPNLSFSVDYIPLANQSTGVKVNASADSMPPYVTTQTGNSIDLTWTSTNATSCTASNDFTPANQPISGATTIGPIYAPADVLRIYTLACYNNNLAPPLSVTKTIGVNIDFIEPYIQTTGGDVHTNENINITPP